ncbi:MAG: shikimate dehydrogenase [Syntrophomonadaceae bacterium]|jgi:shikimate dehydrogenase
MRERITGKTQLLGVLATPISHSKSPIMHNAACAKLGLDYVYLAFDCGNEQLADVVQGFRSLKVRGYNVSMPNKTVIPKYLDKLSTAAELIGAVNTVVNDDGILTGHNTDGIGYMRSIREEGVNVIGKKITILGAGGAANAIIVQAALDGVKEIAIFNRKNGSSFTRAQQLAKIINEKTTCKAQVFALEDTAALREQLANSVLLVNATSVGMKPLEDLNNISDPTLLRPDLVVSDIIYAPAKTKMLQMAEQQGCKIINGLGMMLYQGAEAFKLWTGHEMPVDYIKELLFQ